MYFYLPALLSIVVSKHNRVDACSIAAAASTKSLFCVGGQTCQVYLSKLLRVPIQQKTTVTPWPPLYRNWTLERPQNPKTQTKSKPYLSWLRGGVKRSASSWMAVMGPQRQALTLVYHHLIIPHLLTKLLLTLGTLNTWFSLSSSTLFINHNT